MQAPEPDTLAPAGLVAGPVLVSLLCELLAAAVAVVTGAFDGPAYGVGALLVVVHLWTVGTLAAVILGVGWQLLPVLVAAAPSPGTIRAMTWINRSFYAGLPVLLLGFVVPGPVAYAGASVVLLAFVARGVVVLRALAGPLPPRRGGARLWLFGAELSFAAGMLLGLAMELGRAGHPLGEPLLLLRHHVALILGGGVVGWIGAAGSVLLPMFAVAPEPRSSWIGAAAVGWFAGVVSASPWVAAAGAVVYVAELVRVLRKGLRRGPANLQAASGLLVLPVVLFFPSELAPLAGIVVVVLPLVHGVGGRILPFLLWAHAGAPGPAPELLPRGLAVAQALATAGGAVLLLGSRAASLGLGRVAAAVLLLAAALHLAGLGVAATRAWSARQAALAPAWARRSA